MINQQTFTGRVTKAPTFHLTTKGSPYGVFDVEIQSKPYSVFASGVNLAQKSRLLGLGDIVELVGESSTQFRGDIPHQNETIFVFNLKPLMQGDTLLEANNDNQDLTTGFYI